MPDPATQLCTQDLVWLEQATSLVKRRQSWRCRRWRTSERFQHPDVEYVVNPGSGWQRQAVRHLADAFDDLVWPGEPRAELAATPRQQRLCRTMKDAEPNLVTYLKLQSTMSAIIVALGILLSLEKPSAHIS